MWKMIWESENSLNVQKYGKLVISDRRISTQTIAEELTSDGETVRNILTKEIEIWKTSAKMISRILTNDQKQQ